MHLLHSIYVKRKRTKNMTMNIRQQTMNTPDDILSEKIKIRYRSKHTSIPMTNQRPCTCWRWHHQVPEHDHVKKEWYIQKTEHLTQEHQLTQSDETYPITRQTMTLHTQKGTKAHSKLSAHTYDTQDKYLHAFHTVSSQSFTSLTLTEDL